MGRRERKGRIKEGKKDRKKKKNCVNGKRKEGRRKREWKKGDDARDIRKRREREREAGSEHSTMPRQKYHLYGKKTLP